ncbi:ATP-binding cassette sub-family A member 17-like [Haemaphysalis longicornis]
MVKSRQANTVTSGSGYTIDMRKLPGASFRANHVLSIVRKYANNAQLLSDGPETATVALHTAVPKGFKDMFRELERNRAYIGIRDIRLHVSTLKDIYLRLCILPSIAAAEDIETLIRSKGEGPSRWAQISVLSTERCIFLRRHWVPTIIGWLVPLLILVVSFEWMGVGGYSRKPLPAAVFPVPVSLKQLYPQAKTFLDDDPAATEGIGSYYQKLMDQEGAAVDLYHNSTVMGMLQQDAAENFLAYASHYVLGADFNGGEFVAWYNPYAILSKVLAFDIVSSALLGFRAENASMRFRTTLAIHVPELSPAEDIMALVNERAHDLAHIWVLLAPLAMSVTMAAFVPYASAESRSGFMQLQLMTGVPGWLHCLVNLLFDAVMFIWLAVPVAILFVSFFKLNAASYGTVTLKVLLYLLKDGTNLSLLCTALPPCAVPMAVIKVMVLEWVHDTCDLLATTVIDKDNRTALRAFCLEAANFLEIYQQNQYSGLTGLPVEKCCATLDESYTENWSPFQLHLAAAGLDMCFLLAELVLLFTYLSWRNSGYFLCSDKVGTLGEQLWTDTEVDMEKRKVDCVCDERKAGKEGRWCERFALVLEEVHKWYGDWYALCGLNLALAKNECFGLLGVHGSGKTTVVEILAGVTRLSLGEGYMGELRLSGSPRAWQSQLGYCPQADALMNSFTGLEILEFFARLRGVPGESILPLVEAIASISELGETIFDSCETYSSGMRRKLSTMVALIGIPQLVLLDDPTTGMDMIGRQMIYQTLREITEAQASAVILTSRSTEECQQACSRVGLMIGGDLRGLGDMDRLRRRFSTGMTITFRLNETISHYTAKLVKRAVERLFPKAQQMDLRQGFFLFYIEYRLPWSHVFSRLEKLRQWFRLEKVLVCESSLDELFLGMARTEMAEDAGEARRMAKEASYADYVGDPWGRQPQELHMHAQHHRATKLHDKEEESLKEHEGVASKSNRSAAEMSPKWVPQD